MEGDVKVDLNNRDGEILSIEASHKYEEWFGIRDIGMKIARKAQELGQNLKLDNLTRGKGNCFLIAVLQQINRSEVGQNLDSKLREMASSLNHKELRSKITMFMLKSRLPQMLNYRKQVEQVINLKWSRYCNKMAKNGEYVDSHFVQCTAFYLKRKIMILDENSTQNKPLMEINGNEEAEANSTSLIIGLADEHYQSLLPESHNNKVHENQTKTHSASKSESDDNKVAKNKTETHSTDKEMMVCPVCGKESNKVLWHLSRTKACKESFGAEKLKELLTKSKNKWSIDCTQRYRAKRKAESPLEYKEEMRNQKAKLRKVERSQNEALFKEKTRIQVAKWRKRENSEDRLKAFREGTLFGADFVCVCCEQRMMCSNVVKYTHFKNNLGMARIELQKFIEKEEDSEEEDDGEEKEEEYICKTCANYIRKKKLPPSSAKNGLKLEETDEALKKDDLILTALEASLIAKTIMFQKIFLLPKSRWTALKDKQVNVPITDNAINATLQSFPRTPNEAGLIGVSLKRKKEFKNTHKQQLINPGRIFRFLDKVKAAGNKFYTDINTFETYQKKCRKDDKEGFKLVFGDEDDDSDEDQDMPDELTDEFLENKNYEEKDPVRKHQMVYDKAVVMTDKYPEITVAPGEGQQPISVLFDKGWDVKAYPHLHNADGSNGKDHERDVKLTDQRYFIQRITNREKRFSDCPEYLFSAVGYIEQLQLNRNIQLSGTRGKKVTENSETASFELNDEYRVLENIKGTPKYWQTARYEVLAKNDNFGAFQFFFTLSCADLRWKEGFASIIKEKGFKVRYEVSNRSGHWENIIEVKHNGAWKPIKDFVKEDLEESLHEILRGNVVASTRYFNQRVQTFINTILLAKSNPMCAQFYSYRVEFQERGPGHIHGVIWCNLKKLERLVMIEGKLKNQDNPDKGMKHPLKGLSDIFQKLRTDELMDEDAKEILATFIDSFITVSTNPDIVGEDVAKSAEEVNKHHHTKTCQKFSTECRFHFPKYPAPHTIIAQPMKDSGKKRTKKMEKHSKILEAVKEIIEDEKSIEKIMKKLPKKGSGAKYKDQRVDRIKMLLKMAEVTFEDYLDALQTSKVGSTIILARDVDEVYINQYNVEWMRAWDGNHDLQVCIDFHAVITYITDYMVKPESAMMDVIKAALKESTSSNVKDKMKEVADVFMKTRQMGHAEATYKLIPSLRLKNSNVTCQWVSLGPKEDRSSRWMKATEDQIKAGMKVIELQGHEGFWYEQQDMWKKYLKRPPMLRNICFAQFAKMYRTGKHKSEDEDECEDDEEEKESEFDKDEADFDDDFEKFNYVMTYKREGRNGTKLPQYITLTNRFPGEASTMRKRMFPAALRFHKVKEVNNPDHYMFNEVMLYYPLTKELEKDEVKALFEDAFSGKSKIQIVKSQVMEYLQGVEEARFYAELAKSNEESRNIGEQLDPQLEQDNDDTDEEFEGDENPYSYIDPDSLPKETLVTGGLYKKIDIPNDTDLRENTRKLDRYQKDVLNIAVKFAKDVVKARKFGNKRPTPPMLIVHGGAGAGKSTVINVVTQWTQKIVQQAGDDMTSPCVVKTAFCGTAAANIEGQTLHSAFGFSFNNNYYSLSDKSRDTRRATSKNLVMVIIDEISMVKSDMLYMLDLRLQEITERTGVPFGGIAILTFGDMMQLKPCMGRYIFEAPINQEFYITYKLKPRWKMFKSLTLEINHRQGNDKIYADILNRIRVGQQTDEDMKLLKSRIRKRGHDDLKQVDIFITGKRNSAAKINKNYLAKLDGIKLQIDAVHHQDARGKYKPRINSKDGTVADTGFMDKLELKQNAKVIMIHNVCTTDGLTNGQLGMLKDVLKSPNGTIEKLIVKFNKPNVGTASRGKHPIIARRYPDCVVIERVKIEYSLRKKGGAEGAKASVIQFPIRLAHAITAHKVQGQSIPSPLKVAMDLGSVFEAAQAYVMLSRVQSIDQVYIVEDMDAKKIMIAEKALEELNRIKAESESIRRWEAWDSCSNATFKIATLNCAGLRSHFEDINCDDKLLKGDCLLFQETSLNNEESLKIPNYRETFYTSFGKGKGVATYSKKVSMDAASKSERTVQVMKSVFDKIDIINVYRSADGSRTHLIENLKQLIVQGKTTVIAGDFNICGREESQDIVLKFIAQNGFTKLNDEPTQIQGRQIDYIFINKPTLVRGIERYSPYYSDHDALLLTLKLRVCIF